MVKHMWMVRAGEGAYLLEEFKNNHLIAIGWLNDDDLSKFSNFESLKSRFIETHPDAKKGFIAISVGQIYRFKSEFKIGDRVITYDPDNRVYLIGEIETDYEFNTKLCEYHHIRKVKWLGEVLRDNLSTSTKNTLGAISTIFEIGEEAEKELINLLQGKKKVELEVESQIEEEQLDVYKEDIVNRAHEFIKDMVLKLDWQDMQELVAGILRGMNYKTRISPQGSDRGKDVQASPDGLGLEEPSILVEVKHRRGQMGAPEVRSFIGGLREGTKGIYVSTGGFTKEAKYEADRSTIPLKLIDLDLLANLITEHYEKFDVETRMLIPLTKIYWPVK